MVLGHRFASALLLSAAAFYRTQPSKSQGFSFAANVRALVWAGAGGRVVGDARQPEATPQPQATSHETRCPAQTKPRGGVLVQLAGGRHPSHVRSNRKADHLRRSEGDAEATMTARHS